MDLYEELYHLMFNAATDAIRELEQQNVGLAAEILRRAQQKAEEQYLDWEG